MKKNRLALLAFLLCSLSAFSQHQIGAYILPENTQIQSGIPSSDPIYKNKSTYAGGGGLSYTYNITSWLGIQTGVQYTVVNQKFTSHYLNADSSYGIYNGKKRLGYVSIPVLLKSSWRMNDRFSFTYSLGAQLSYLVRGRGAVMVYKHFTGYDYFDLPASSPKDYNRFLVEGVAAAGIDYRIDKRISINAAFRASYSMFTNVQNTSAVYNFEGKGSNVPLYSYGNTNPPKTHNVAMGLQLGVTYDIGNNSLICPSDKWK